MTPTVICSVCNRHFIRSSFGFVRWATADEVKRCDGKPLSHSLCPSCYPKEVARVANEMRG